MVRTRRADRGRVALWRRTRGDGRFRPRGRRDERRDGDRNVARRSFLHSAPSARQLGNRRRALRVATFSWRGPLHEMKSANGGTAPMRTAFGKNTRTPKRSASLIRSSSAPVIAGRRTKTESHLRSRSEEHTSELQSLRHLVCRLLLEKKQIN